jgi:hypothetical protein
MFMAIGSIVGAVVAVIGMSFYSLSAPVAAGVFIVGMIVGLGIDQLRARRKI